MCSALLYTCLARGKGFSRPVCLYGDCSEHKFSITYVKVKNCDFAYWSMSRRVYTCLYGFRVNLIFVCVCVFVCSAGAGRTGTFIALSNILERVKAEGLLDVFQTVKSLRMQRPHMVQTVVCTKPPRNGFTKNHKESPIRVYYFNDLEEFGAKICKKLNTFFNNNK